jgi:hypothetical protein
VKRHDLEDVTRCGQAWREMKEASDGDWVRFDDAQAALAAVTAERDAALDQLAKLAESGTGYSQQTMNAMVKERTQLTAERDAARACLATFNGLRPRDVPQCSDFEYARANCVKLHTALETLGQLKVQLDTALAACRAAEKLLISIKDEDLTDPIHDETGDIIMGVVSRLRAATSGAGVACPGDYQGVGDDRCYNCAELGKREAKYEAAVAMLREIQWSGWKTEMVDHNEFFSDNIEAACPKCHVGMGAHDRDCALAALLEGADHARN